MRAFTAILKTVAQSKSSDDRHDDGDYQEVGTVQPHSVLDIYRQAASIGPPGVECSPNRKPDGHLMLDSIRSILFSGRSDNAISGELAEFLGFDNLELASDALRNRGQFFEEQTLTPLPSKGEGKPPGSPSLSAAGEFAHTIVSDSRSLAPTQVRRRMEEQLQANASRPLFTGTAVSHTVSSNMAHLVLS